MTPQRRTIKHHGHGAVSVCLWLQGHRICLLLVYKVAYRLFFFSLIEIAQDQGNEAPQDLSVCVPVTLS